MRANQTIHLVIVVAALIAAATSRQLRPSSSSDSDLRPTVAPQRAVATGTATPIAAEKEPEYLEPDLYYAVEQLERERNGGKDGYWPVSYTVVDREEGRYAHVRTTFFGSGRAMWLLVQPSARGAWKALGRADRMGEGNSGPMTAEEKKELGVDQLPEGVWQALGEATEHVFNPETDAQNQAYEADLRRAEASATPGDGAGS